MLRLYFRLSDLNFGKLMSVYEDGNRENARVFYSRMDRNAAILRAEQDFYAFLKDVFFTTENARYAVWEEDGEYISALRLEPYRDGLLLAALETSPRQRRKGFAKKLILGSLSDLNVPVYSHVYKENEASILTHLACGFKIISEQAEYLDGTVVLHSCTLCRKPFGL